MASRDAFGCFTFTVFSAKNVPVVAAVMIIPFLIVFSVFLPIKTTHLLYRVFSSSDLKHMTSFWFNRFFMDDLSCLLVVCKKCANANGKDSKYTNAININIIWLYCRLYCRLFCRLYCRLFFVTQYLFFFFFSRVQQAYDLERHAQDIFLVLLLLLSFLFNRKSTRMFISDI